MPNNKEGPPDPRNGEGRANPANVEEVVTTPPNTLTAKHSARRRNHVATCPWCRSMSPERPRGSRGVELVDGFGRRHEAAKRLVGGDPEAGWWR